jgi:hypothetical protein
MDLLSFEQPGKRTSSKQAQVFQICKKKAWVAGHRCHRVVERPEQFPQKKQDLASQWCLPRYDPNNPFTFVVNKLPR